MDERLQDNVSDIKGNEADRREITSHETRNSEKERGRIIKEENQEQ